MINNNNQEDKSIKETQVPDVLLTYYDSFLELYGDTALGASWPNENDKLLRYKIGYEIIEQISGQQHVTICDLGCGTGEFYRYMKDNAMFPFSYIGVDLSDNALCLARKKFPMQNFLKCDILNCPEEDMYNIECDFVFANGLFTVKDSASYNDMWQFMTAVIERLWPAVRQGILFNVMSKIVDWERDDLFHVSYDDLAKFLHKIAGRSIGFRADYGLYEVMAYAVKSQVLLKNSAPVDKRQALLPSLKESDPIPVNRPLLPKTEHLATYLSTIDSNRQYTNHGELSKLLIQRLSRLMGVEMKNICLTASGTIGLLGAIYSIAGRAKKDRPFAICPGYTFIATASAVEMAGYQPYFVDVNLYTWEIDPLLILNHPMLDRVGLVIVAAPYGKNIQQQGWEDFYNQTGIPVVIDAAGSFEAICKNFKRQRGVIPTVVSMHATKSFSTGEGGLILCKDQSIIERAFASINFGFHGCRESITANTNGKMSEYHAAIGLAEIDGWNQKSSELRRVADLYMTFSSKFGIADRIITAPQISSSYVIFMAENAEEGKVVQDSLHKENINFRHWYGPGLHLEPYYRTAGNHLHDNLLNTELLGKVLIGLPVAPDLSSDIIHKIILSLLSGVNIYKNSL